MSVDETLKWDHSNASYRVLFRGTVYSIMLHKLVLSFESVDEILSVTIQLKAIAW